MACPRVCSVRSPVNSCTRDQCAKAVARQPCRCIARVGLSDPARAHACLRRGPRARARVGHSRLTEETGRSTVDARGCGPDARRICIATTCRARCSRYTLGPFSLPRKSRRRKGAAAIHFRSFGGSERTRSADATRARASDQARLCTSTFGAAGCRSHLPVHSPRVAVRHARRKPSAGSDGARFGVPLRPAQ